jgi:hypothetical protein
VNAAVIGTPERSEIPEVGPKDTERDRAVKHPPPAFWAGRVCRFAGWFPASAKIRRQTL